VASDLPGYRNVALPHHHGVLVPPGDPGSLATALERVLTDATLAEELVGAGELRAAEFSMDRLAERYLELYDSVRARAR
jgi:glycosyltransferase involved in cell wall biosynthesis